MKTKIMTNSKVKEILNEYICQFKPDQQTKVYGKTEDRNKFTITQKKMYNWINNTTKAEECRQHV